MSRKKVTLQYLNEKKAGKEKITMLTTYDFPMALAVEKAGIEIILVGDSLGMTTYGFDSTLPVTMDMMVRHTRTVRMGTPSAYLVGDMPYMSYQPSIEDSVRNAGRLMSEGGADIIKLEGGKYYADTVKAISSAGIPVMGHIGLTPQFMGMLGGFKAQGRTAEAAKIILEDAMALEAAGLSLLLVEAVPPAVGKVISEKLSIPVIGIGAGLECDGQLLIIHDMLGFFEAFTPKFVKQYENLNGRINDALLKYVDDVKNSKFPEDVHNYKMPEEEVEKFLKLV